MTYKELARMCKGKTFPLCGKNEDGENVILTKGCDKWHHGTETWERNYFSLQVAQHNGWTRHDVIFEDGDSEVFYERSNK